MEQLLYTYMILKTVNVNNYFKTSQSEKNMCNLYHKGLINLIYKEFLKIKKKTINCPIEKWTKESYGS